MAYEIDLPDGSRGLIHDNVPRSKALEAAQRAYPDAFPPPPTALGQALSAPKNIAMGAGSGIVSAIGGLGALPYTGLRYFNPEMKPFAETGFGKKITETEQSLAPTDEGYGSQLSHGLGSFLSVFGPQAIARGVGTAGRFATGIAPKAATPIAVAQTSGLGAEEARNRVEAARAEGKIVTPGEEFGSLVAGVPAGLTELLPVQSLFKATRGLDTGLTKGFQTAGFEGVKNFGKRALQQAGIEAAQEAGSGAIQDVIAQQIYNPEQEIGGSALKEAALGGGVGAIAQLGLDLALRKDIKMAYQISQKKKNDEDLAKQMEEVKAETAKKRAETDAALGISPLLALPAPKEQITPSQAKHPIYNPLGNFSEGDLDPANILAINAKRAEENKPKLKSFSIEDLADSGMSQADISGLVAKKTGYAGTEADAANIPQHINDVLSLAAEKNVDPNSQGFKDFLRRATGLDDLQGMSAPQLYSAYTAVYRLPDSATPQDLHPGTSATRFSEGQYDTTIKNLNAAHPSDNALTLDDTISQIKDHSGLKNDTDAESLMHTAIRRGDLFTKAYPAPDGTTSISVHVPNANKEAGPDIRKSSVESGIQPESYVIKSSAGAIEEHPTQDAADARVAALTVARQAQADRSLKAAAALSKETDKAQTDLDAMAARGESNTLAFQQKASEVAAKTQANQAKAETLNNTAASLVEPLVVEPKGQQITTKDVHTVYEGNQPIAAFDTAEKAQAHALSRLPEEELQKYTGKLGEMAQNELAQRQRKEPGISIIQTGGKEKAEEVLLSAGIFTGRFKQKAEELDRHLRPLMSRLGLGDLRLNIAHAIESGGADGKYAEKIISIALDAKYPIRVLRHEGIHALKELGFFTPEQWRILENKAKSEWVEKYNILERYADLNVDEQLEEAIADAFSDFDQTKPPAGLIGVLFNKLKTFMEALSNAIEGLGFDTHSSIFGRVSSGGEMAPIKPVITERVSVGRKREPVADAPEAPPEAPVEVAAPLPVAKPAIKTIETKGTAVRTREGKPEKVGSGAYKLVKDATGYKFKLLADTFEGEFSTEGKQPAQISSTKQISMAKPEPVAKEEESKPVVKVEKPTVNKSVKMKKLAKARKVILSADTMNEAIIKMGGINLSLRPDLTGDNKGNQNLPFVGSLFSKNGTTDLSDLALNLGQYGYFTPEETEGVDGGARLLADRLRGEFDGGSPHQSMGNMDDAADAALYKRQEEEKELFEAAQAAAKKKGEEFYGAVSPDVLDVLGIPVTPEVLVNGELLARAIAISPEKVDDIATQYEGFVEGFNAAIAKFIKEQRNGGIQTDDGGEIFGDSEAGGTQVQDKKAKFSRRQTETPAFKQWFGKSKAVNADGTPKVYYHGTARDIGTFKPKRSGAIFLTVDPVFASGFASLSKDWMKKRDLKGGENIMPLYIRAENPFDYDNPKNIETVISHLVKKYPSSFYESPGSKEVSYKEKLTDDLARGRWTSIEDPSIQEAIKETGFDSFYVEEAGRKNLAVYKENQVKSAIGNTGAFSRENDDVRYSRKVDRLKATGSSKAWIFFSEANKGINFTNIKTLAEAGEAAEEHYKDQIKNIPEFDGKAYMEGLTIDDINAYNAYPQIQDAIKAYKEGNKAEGIQEILDIVASQRRANIKEWKNYLENINPEMEKDPFWRDYVITSLLKSIRTDKPDPGLPLNANALGQVYEKFKQGNHVNFKTIYKSKLVDTTNDLVELGDETTGWRKIPQTSKNDPKFGERVKAVTSLSCTGWCTRGDSYATDYIQRGDFWVYVDDKKPQVAIRFEGDKVHEIQGPQNTRAIPTKYIKEITSLVDSGKIKNMTGKTKGDIAKAVRKSQFEAMIKEGLASGELVERDRASDEVHSAAMVDEGTKIYVAADGSIIVDGSLSMYEGASIPNLTTVGGFANIRQGTSVPALTTVGGEASIYKGANVPNLTTVGGDAYIYDSAPKLTTVGGDADISEGAGVPNLTTVGGDAYIRRGASVPKLTTVGGVADIYPEANVPSLTTVGGAARITKGASVPNLTTVGGTAIINEGASAPALTTVGGKATIEGSAPALTTVGGYANIRKGASVPKLTTVGGYANIYSSAPALATVGGDATIYSSVPKLTTVGGDAIINEEANVPNLTTVGGNTTIYGSAPKLTTVGDNANIREGASVPNLTTVGGDAYIYEGGSAPNIKRKGIGKEAALKGTALGKDEGKFSRRVRYSRRENSKGQPIHPTEAGTENFFKWFGDSKATDKEGRPLLLYTGTSKDTDFSIFKVPRNGAWFTTSASDASGYAVTNDSDTHKWVNGKVEAINRASRVIPVYLKITNPYITSGKDFNAKIFSAAKENYKRGQGIEFDKLRQAGYDGVVLSGDTWIALNSPSQIKSAIGNTGEYSDLKGNIKFSRRELSHKDVTKRTPELQAAAAKVKSGEMTRAAYEKLVNKFKPVTPYESIPDPATPKEAINALKADQKDKYGIPSATLEEGHPVGLRLDIPAYSTYGTWVPAVHEQEEGFKAGKVIGYESFAAVTDPTLGVSGKAALSIAEGSPKGTIATIKGNWKPVSKKQAMKMANDALNDPSWTQVGMDPERHSYFYDRTTMEPVVSGDIAIQIGPLVLVHNPKYASKKGYKFSRRAGYAPSAMQGAAQPMSALDEANSDLSPDMTAAINRTTTARKNEGWSDRIAAAFSPRSFTAFRQAFIHGADSISNLTRESALQFGEQEYHADRSAIAAVLFADRAAGIAASSFVNGPPVYKNGFASVPENSTVRGLIPILEPIMKGGAHMFQRFQFYAGTRRGSRLMYETRVGKDGKTITSTREQNFTKEDIERGKILEKMHPEFKQVFEEYQQYNNGLVQFMKDTGVISAKEAELWTKNWDYIPFYRQMDGDRINAPAIFSSISGVKKPKELKGGEAPLADFMETVIRNSRAAIEAGMKNVAGQRTIRDLLRLNQASEVPPATKGYDIVSIKQAGVTKFYRVDDSLVYEALKGLDAPHLPFVEILAKPANFLRDMVTKDPGFMLANLARDSMQAWVTSGVNMTPLFDTFKQAGKAMLGSNPEAAALARSGYFTGYDFAGDTKSSAAAVEKELRKRTGTQTGAEKALMPLSKIMDVLDKGAHISDLATRAEVYKRVLEETGSEAEATYQALEIMNFSRKGNSALIRIVTALVPFMNARIQGMDVLYRTGFGRSATVHNQKQKKLFATRSLTILGLTAMYLALASDTEEYKNATPEERDNYWILGGLGRIPIPFELGVLFKVFPERIYQHVWGMDTGSDLRQSIARNLTSTLVMNPIPHVAMPIIENIANYSAFTGQPIVGKGMEGVYTPYQFNPSTSLLAQLVGKETNQSPLKIDNLIRGYTGTLGTYAVMMLDAVMRGEGDDIKATKTLEQMPVFKRFMTTKQGSGTINAYYELKKEVDTAVKTVNFLERQGDYEELAVFQTGRGGKLLGIKDYMKGLDEEMSSLRAFRSAARRSRMDPDSLATIESNIKDAEINVTKNIQFVKKALD